MNDANPRALIDDLFEELVLAVGGLIASHPVGDEFVCRMVRSLEVVRSKALRRLSDGQTPGHSLSRNRLAAPHPAIEQFLAQLGRR